MDFSVLIIGAVVALVIIIIIVSIIVILLIRRKSNRVVQTEEISERKPSIAYTQTSFYSTSTRKVDSFEVDRSCILIDSRTPLGRGAFGSVFLGKLSRANWTDWNGAVAVKMQSGESTTDSHQQEFLREINTMKTIGYHERLANILACVTLSSPIVLVLEYCANGDLLSYMRKRLTYMIDHSNRLSVDPQFMITQRQQLMFAAQIAQGLEFISQRGFIHRDVAARNILVDSFNTCKIGDFGLCREVGKAPDHYQSVEGKLPIRWMSPEAIESSHFSTASDVWSYGILLFEIITLGGYPYPRWHVQEVLNRLKAGERMPRSESSTDSMFTLMQHCWMGNPSMRPSFTHIRRFLGQEINTSIIGSYYAVINGQADYYLASTDNY